MSGPPEVFVPEDMIAFYQELLSITPDEGTVRVAPPGPEEKEQWEAGVPLVLVAPPSVDAASFFAVLRRVADTAVKHNPGLAQDVMPVLEALPDDPVEQELFVASVLSREGTRLEQLARDAHLPREALGFLINHALKPIMRAYAAEAVKWCDTEQWRHGVCPVCGGRPSLAILEKEVGRRYLYCGLCDTRWRYKRLGCPFCDTEAPHGQEFFTLEGNEKYRIYVCNTCRGYLKTIDERRAGEEEIDLFWEDISTVHLDILAMREGYVNRSLEPV
ncbi:MAG: formate dehydrogenase accessory protein FdhE [Desulfotomaculales bacterium]